MGKATAAYWNPLATGCDGHWRPVAGLQGIAEELTLAADPATGEYTRLTRFLPGADTTRFGGKSMRTRKRFSLSAAACLMPHLGSG
jgi:hypothetical protein